MTRDLNPDRLDDGARAEAEMRERGAELAKLVFGITLSPATQPLPAPQGDDGLADRLRNYGLSHMKGMPSVIDEAVSALRAKAAEIAGLKGRLEDTIQEAERHERLYRKHEDRAEAAEAKFASAMEALEKIKERVTGDRHPRWGDDYAVTGSRMSIADICDATLSSIKGAAE